MLAAELGRVRVTHVTDSAGMKGSWKSAEAWRCVGRAGVPEETPGEAIGESAAQLQRRPQHFGDARAMGCPPRTAAVEWSQLGPGRQAVCAAEGRDREVTCALSRNPEDGEWVLDTGH